MRRVLCVAYHFPPLGGAGVQRSLKFVQHLPECGYEPIVITAPGEASEWAPIDSTLGGELTRTVPVERVPGPLPADEYNLRWRLERLAWLPSAFRRWWVDGVLECGLRHRGADLIYATMGPYESGEAAARLARRLGVPWVADLRDPWALDEMMEYPTALHRRVALRQMGRVLEAADAVIMNTPEAAERVRRTFPGLTRTRVSVVPNGFDASDFAAGFPRPPAAPFRIVHTGSMHTAAGLLRQATPAWRRRLGGLAEVDQLTRSHVFLLEGLAELLRDRPELASGIELHLAGALSEADRAVEGHGLVREHGYLGHKESVALVRSADLLFLPMQDLPLGTRATIVPGKTYEYLGSGRPLLAALPDGDARDLLSTIPWAHVCRPADGRGMARVVARLAERRHLYGAEPDGDTRMVAGFERRALTRRLAGVFDATRAGEASRQLAAAA